jgi:hypothetical protein
MEKKCTKCQRLLPIGEFTKNKNQPDGYFYRCKECENKRKKEFYYSGYNKIMSEKQPSRREYTKTYFNNMDIFKLRFRTAKQRARKSGLEFNITLEHILSLYEKQNRICYISGVELSLEKHSPRTVSLDRIDSSKGYVIGNVVLCTDFINRSKSDYTIDEFKELILEIKISR